MFQILYFIGGVRKTQSFQDFHKTVEHAVHLDTEGYLLSSISKLDKDNRPVKTIWELRDNEQIQDSLSRLKGILENTKV